MEELRQRFYRHFAVESTRLQELIAGLEHIAPVAGERQDAVEHILAGISRLHQEVADAKELLPPYELRNYSLGAKAVSDLLEAERAKFEPRRRFQFRARSSAAPADPKTDARRNIPVSDGFGSLNAMVTSQSESNKAKDTLPEPAAKNYNEEISRAQGVRKPSFTSARDIELSGHTKTHIILPASASRATSFGRLTNLDGCVIDMSIPTGKTGAPFASLSINNVKTSLIIAGHVDGSVHITGVKDSKLVLVARQVRIHDCENVDLYLHCASHPIIENCKGMRFAPAPRCYLSEAQDDASNQWDQVDDFKWLKTEHSPNWSILPEEERIEDGRWKVTLAGVPGEGVEEIFQKMGFEPKA
ncbi:tubulin binding cofactor C-domain-containing protein [Podospora conica]|nr:tubulin binding cofactor C-domain-containing protein [Schizothecium conicum]